MPLDSPSKKKAAFEVAGAMAVDMESAAVAAIAAAHQLPFVALRVIIDTASDALPQSGNRGKSRGGDCGSEGCYGQGCHRVKSRRWSDWRDAIASR